MFRASSRQAFCRNAFNNAPPSTFTNESGVVTKLDNFNETVFLLSLKFVGKMIGVETQRCSLDARRTATEGGGADAAKCCLRRTTPGPTRQYRLSRETSWPNNRRTNICPQTTGSDSLMVWCPIVWLGGDDVVPNKVVLRTPSHEFVIYLLLPSVMTFLFSSSV